MWPKAHRIHYYFTVYNANQIEANSLNKQNGQNSVNFEAIWLKFYMKVNETFMKFGHPADTLMKNKILPRQKLKFDQIWRCLSDTGSDGSGWVATWKYKCS